MSDSETAAVGDAPDRESTSEHRPSQPAAAMTWRQALDANKQPIHLTLEQSTRLRGRIDALIEVCDEIGVQGRVVLRCIDEVSAFDLLPEGDQHSIAYTSPVHGMSAYGVRDLEVGVHAIHAYTGDLVALPVRTVETTEDAS